MEQVDRPVHVVGAEHHVDVGGSRLDLVAILLGQAPRHHDLQPGSGVLERLEVTQGAVELVVGVLPDAAGVEDDHIRVVGVGGRHHAVGFEQAGDALGVVFVHLAPEGADEIALLFGGSGSGISRHGRRQSTGRPQQAPGPRTPSASGPSRSGRVRRVW